MTLKMATSNGLKIFGRIRLRRKSWINLSKVSRLALVEIIRSKSVRQKFTAN